MTGNLSAETAVCWLSVQFWPESDLFNPDISEAVKENLNHWHKSRYTDLLSEVTTYLKRGNKSLPAVAPKWKHISWWHLVCRIKCRKILKLLCQDKWEVMQRTWTEQFIIQIEASTFSGHYVYAVISQSI